MRRTFAALLLLVTVSIVPAAFAQEEPETMEDRPDSIARPVYVPGKLDVEVPSAERQQMTGADAPAAVLVLPADRRPLVETYRQSTADLPSNSLNRPAPPSVSALADKKAQQLEVEASAGRYGSRILRGTGSLPLSTSSLLTGDIDYRGSGGHESETVPGAKSSFDTFRGAVGLATRARRLAAGATASAFSDSYKLYGIMNGPDRTGTQGRLNGWIETRGDSPLSFRTDVDFSTTSYETKMLGTGSYGQSLVMLTSDLGAPFMGGLITAGATLNQSAMDGYGDGNNNTVDLRGTYRFLYRRYYQVTLGAHLMTYNAAYTALGDSEAKGQIVAPEARIEFYPVVGMRVYGQNVPSISYNSISEVFQLNPFLTDVPVVLPTVRPIDAQGGVNVFLGALQVGGRAGLQYASQYLYFTTSRLGAPATAYEKARIAYIAGDLTMVLPGGFNGTVSASMRDGQLTDLHRDIPYFGALTGSAQLSWSFADDRGLLQATSRYESSRKISTETDEELGSFVDLDLLASYYVTPRTGIIVRLENVMGGSLEQWKGYNLAPTIITLGATMRW